MPGLRGVVFVVEDGVGGEAGFAEDGFSELVEVAGGGLLVDGWGVEEEVPIDGGVWWEFVLKLGE